ncbi:hypothetical protein E9549_16425 [Blastococcus sp. MG754426]|uniref:hypothetical protein n=1 Tax=unclassified Blastococcus TaxID=2619396 RepID=UPI001EF0E6CD|nr:MULTISPECIES: hypothetical protein [unclassified Blastococcus]MCF6508979.1 hypothetical protein [Blastococcus sp. MG754426]MCF6513652.1 hypothetical protein [Blastococcus sp. MG754427]MCF6736451.1 hypothetical protein [Blastococcus sp. KM273129]
METTRKQPLAVAVVALARCAAAGAGLAVRGRIHHPRTDVGVRLAFPGGRTSWVYRETVVERPPAREPCVLLVEFRLRGVRGRGHAWFRAESWLNLPLFVGFPGLLTKWWVAADDDGVYRGLYEYDGAGRADGYARSLAWVLGLVSVRGSVRHEVVPGARRSDVVGPAGPGGVRPVRLPVPGAAAGAAR